MTGQAGQQIITTLISSNNSRSKSNQAMQFGQLIEYNVRNIFLQKSCQDKAGRLVSNLFLLCKKYKIEASGQHVSFNIFW